ncbi:cation:proton antiporter [Nocardiopsis sp. CNT-189]|uniref:cation:proton antiporter domain-containing protein n=1 Tax=Nocardiopsis oceanisediminis TaxID=2816862 RepID=UPI003B33A26B
MEPAFIIAAFAGGLAALALRLPPLVGFLVAGFALNALGHESTPALEAVADLGVALLLFTIGLKLDVRALLRREVCGTASAHLALSMPLLVLLLSGLKAAGLVLLQGTGWAAPLLLGFALSFSSTVFAVKVLDARSEARSLYGRLAIGVLVVQDVFAVVFITAAGTGRPEVWAPALLLLLPLAPLLRRLLDRIGHGEMQVLFGVFAALVLGYALFALAGIKGDLGALVLGALLAPAANSVPLAKAVFALKDLFLVGFFLAIGLSAMPEPGSLGLALGLLLLAPLKGALFTALFLAFRLRGRTALLAGAALGNFSEFGLIVGAGAVARGWLPEEWLAVLALTVALSFIASAPLNARGEAVYHRLAPWLQRWERAVPLPGDRPIDITGARAVVLGMGRVGCGAYERLHDAHGLPTVGVEHDPAAVRRLAARGYRVVEGDAADPGFWARLELSTEVELIVLAMPSGKGNLAALDGLRRVGHRAVVAGVVAHAEELDELRRRGVDEVHHMHAEAGRAIADDAVRRRMGR